MYEEYLRRKHLLRLLDAVALISVETLAKPDVLVESSILQLHAYDRSDATTVLTLHLFQLHQKIEQNEYNFSAYLCGKMRCRREWATRVFTECWSSGRTKS